MTWDLAYGYLYSEEKKNGDTQESLLKETFKGTGE